MLSSPAPTPTSLYRTGTWAWPGPSCPASQRATWHCPVFRERRARPGCGPAGGKGRRGSQEARDDAHRMGTIEGGRWERALTPSHGASRVRGPRKLDQDPQGLPGRRLVSPPRARTWEPWQRGFYGGRAGPGGAAFADSGGSRRREWAEERLPARTQGHPATQT